MHNLTQATQGGDEALEDEVRISYCLDRCGTCYEESFLVIDGELASGPSYEEILQTHGSE